MSSDASSGQSEPASATDAGGSDATSTANRNEAYTLTRRIAELTEENARLHEEVSARDGFIAVAAHELKNALTPLVARIDLFRHRMAGWQPEKIEANLVQIEQLTAIFARRATTLLDISRMASGKLQLDGTAVKVDPVARSICENYRPLAERARCELTLDLPEANLTIVGDQLALEQILDNLISNAIKYGAGAPIVVSATEGDGHVMFEVSDWGPGISPEAQARIFERFERAVRPGQAAGFGVGLWVVKQLCEAMGGKVEVTSMPGTGSTFRVTLPAYATKDPQ